jgi:hypothetical protein
LSGGAWPRGACCHKELKRKCQVISGGLVGGFEEGREFKAWGRKEKEDRAFNANTKPWPRHTYHILLKIQMLSDDMSLCDWLGFHPRALPGSDRYFQRVWWLSSTTSSIFSNDDDLAKDQRERAADFRHLRIRPIDENKTLNIRSRI